MNKQVETIAQQADTSLYALPPEIIVLDAAGRPRTYKLMPLPAEAPAVAPPGEEYVDPFLFESDYFKSREEHDELSRTARIIPRKKP